MTVFSMIIFFIFGTIIGSFLNVCIYRIPRNKSIILPNSYCPKCQKYIKFYDNIPLISYFILGGKCRNCKEKISFRYPLVEFITGIIFVLCLNTFNIESELASLITYILFSSILIAISFIDIEHYIIPDSLSFSLMIVGVVSSLFKRYPNYDASIKTRLISSITGLLVIGGIWLVITIIGNKIYLKKIGKQAMGMGDVKLFAAIGSFLNFKLALITLYVSILIAGFGSIIIMILFKKGLKDQIPLGPFIALGGFVMIFYSSKIINFWETIFNFYY